MSPRTRFIHMYPPFILTLADPPARPPAMLRTNPSMFHCPDHVLNIDVQAALERWQDRGSYPIDQFMTLLAGGDLSFGRRDNRDACR